MLDAHELWAAAQLAPNEGVDAGVARIEALLASSHNGSSSTALAESHWPGLGERLPRGSSQYVDSVPACLSGIAAFTLADLRACFGRNGNLPCLPLTRAANETLKG